jgi:hypothetical protein
LLGITPSNKFTKPFELSGTTSSHPENWYGGSWKLICCLDDNEFAMEPLGSVFPQLVGVASTDLKSTPMRKICALKSLSKWRNGKQCNCCNADMSIYYKAIMIAKMLVLSVLQPPTEIPTMPIMLPSWFQVPAFTSWCQHCSQMLLMWNGVGTENP